MHYPGPQASTELILSRLKPKYGFGFLLGRKEINECKPLKMSHLNGKKKNPSLMRCPQKRTSLTLSSTGRDTMSRGRALGNTNSIIRNAGPPLFSTSGTGALTLRKDFFFNPTCLLFKERKIERRSSIHGFVGQPASFFMGN